VQARFGCEKYLFLFLANIALSADGGGVRGLSSLLILKELMRQINVSIRTLSHSSDLNSNLLPHDIFDLVAGTSTGGLISLMLGKLGMNVKDCIEEYRNFSKAIFKRRQLLAIGGLARSKYSGLKLERCVRNLVRRRRSRENLDMPFNENDKIAW
jgi:patatin-like phospholipase/acyl hydrolase